MSRALRLHETHTKAELVAKLEALKSDPEMQAKDGVWQLNKQGQRMLDDLILAIYWHDRPGGNSRMHAAPPSTKNW